MYLVTERLSSDLYEFIGEHSSGVGEVRELVVIIILCWRPLSVHLHVYARPTSSHHGAPRCRGADATRPVHLRVTAAGEEDHHAHRRRRAVHALQGLRAQVRRLLLHVHSSLLYHARILLSC